MNDKTKAILQITAPDGQEFVEKGAIINQTKGLNGICVELYIPTKSIQNPVDTNSIKAQIAQAEADKEAYPDFCWELWQYEVYDGKRGLDWDTVIDNNHIFSNTLIYRQHPHRENIIQFNKCSEADKNRWQWRVNDGCNWTNCSDSKVGEFYPIWENGIYYRLRPRACFITMQDGTKMEYPEPVREALEVGQDYCCVTWSGVICTYWNDDDSDYERLRQGSIHLTEEAAQQHRSALRTMNAQVAA